MNVRMSTAHIDTVSLQSTAQTVSPFQFRNSYSDESYDAEVKVSTDTYMCHTCTYSNLIISFVSVLMQVCAPGFQNDSVLKSEVRTRATKLFEELASSANQVDRRNDEFNHNAIPFKIECLKVDELNPPAPVTQESLDMASGMTPAAFDPEADSKKNPGAPY